MPGQTPDYESFERFYTQFYQTIYRYCISWEQSPLDAEEIADEAMFRLSKRWEERGKLPDTENLKWLYIAAKNVIHEYWKANAKHISAEPEESIHMADETEVEREIIEQEQYAFYLREIQTELTCDEWDLFIMAFVDELPYSEIRKKLSLNKETLRARLYRLRKKIKPYLRMVMSKPK